MMAYLEAVIPSWYPHQST